MTAKPYVGITGPVTVSETKDICQEFSNADYTLETNHIPMLGFLVSFKNLNGEATRNRRYPPLNTLSELLRATDNRVLTMIHYNTPKPDSLSDQVARLFDGIYETGLCRSIQLNIVWPEIGQVMKIKERYPEMQIVFQASDTAMANKTATQIANGIKDYGNSIDYVLIDPSGGRGLLFDLSSSLAVYSEVKEHCPDLTVGFAGGFTGENVASRVQEILQQLGDNSFSIDAEGGLRDKITSAYGDDLLNLEKVRSYLQEASLVLK